MSGFATRILVSMQFVNVMVFWLGKSFPDVVTTKILLRLISNPVFNHFKVEVSRQQEGQIFHTCHQYQNVSCKGNQTISKSFWSFLRPGRIAKTEDCIAEPPPQLNLISESLRLHELIHECSFLSDKYNLLGRFR